MCNLYSITTNQAAIGALFRIVNRYVGNLQPMPGVFPDYKAPIVRNGEKEATLTFLGFPGQEEELELTYNEDGRTYELGTAYGHIAVGVDDLAETLEKLGEQGIHAEREPYRVREGGSLLCFVQDPDGYRIELIDRSGR